MPRRIVTSRRVGCARATSWRRSRSTLTAVLSRAKRMSRSRSASWSKKPETSSPVACGSSARSLAGSAAGAATGAASPVTPAARATNSS
jgi:hypothetical protein